MAVLTTLQDAFAAIVALQAKMGTGASLPPGGGEALHSDAAGESTWRVTAITDIPTLQDALNDLGSALTPVGANTIYAGPASGADANPTFRALVSADLPAHTHAIAGVTGLQAALDLKANAANAALTGAATITSNAAAAFAVGQNGATNPALSVSGAAVGTGIHITPAAAGGGVTIAAISSGGDENLIFTPKGNGKNVFSGYVGLGATSPKNLLHLNTAVLQMTLGGNGPNIGYNAYYDSGWKRIATGGAFAFAIANATPDFAFFAAGSDATDSAITFTERVRITNAAGDLNLATGALGFGSAATPDIGLARPGASVLRATNGSTGAGQLLIGTSSESASAQLSVYSASTTRPAIKAQAASGTSGSQEVLGVYDGSGALAFRITANGALQPASLADTAAPSNSIYYSTTQSKLCYKDSGGVVNTLY